MKLQSRGGVFSVIGGNVTLLSLFVYLHLVTSLHKKPNNSFMVKPETRFVWQNNLDVIPASL